jgi:hypothetical protein
LLDDGFGQDSQCLAVEKAQSYRQSQPQNEFD